MTNLVKKLNLAVSGSISLRDADLWQMNQSPFTIEHLEQLSVYDIMQTWPVNLPIIFCGLPQTCHRPNSRCCCRVGCLPYGGLVSRRSWVQLSVTGVLDSYWGYSSSVRSSERYEIVPGSCLTVWRRCSCRERQDQSFETHLEYGIFFSA